MGGFIAIGGSEDNENEKRKIFFNVFKITDVI